MAELRVDQVAPWKGRVQDLTTALAANRVTATAVGLVMGQHRVDRQQAFALLVEQSQRSDTRLSTIAGDVVAQAEADARRDCA